MSSQRRQIVIDSRLPVGENTSSNDATHPRNIVLLAANTEAQAAADQRYDINPPPRVEGFISTFFSKSNAFHPFPFYINVFVLCLLFVAVLYIKQRVVKIVLSVGIIFVLHQVIKQFGSKENRSTCANH